MWGQRGSDTGVWLKLHFKEAASKNIVLQIRAKNGLNRTRRKSDHDTFNGIKNGWRQNLCSATQNTNDVRGKQKILDKLDKY